MMTTTRTDATAAAFLRAICKALADDARCTAARPAVDWRVSVRW